MQRKNKITLPAKEVLQNWLQNQMLYCMVKTENMASTIFDEHSGTH